MTATGLRVRLSLFVVIAVFIMLMVKPAALAQGPVFLPAHRQPISAGNAGQITLLATLPAAQERITAVAFTPDSQDLILLSDDQTVRSLDLASGAISVLIDQTLGAVDALACGAGLIALGGGPADLQIYLLNAPTGTAAGRLPGHEQRTGAFIGVETLVFSPDGKWLFSAGSDNTVRVWDVAGFAQVSVLEGRSSKALAYRAQDGTLATVATGTPPTIMLTTGDLARQWPAHTAFISTLAFSPDGTLLASGGGDNRIILWDVAADSVPVEPVRTLTGHITAIETVLFSPDGTLLVSLGDAVSLTHSEGQSSATWEPAGRVVRLWEVATGAELGLLQNEAGMTAVALSPDGTLLATGDDDGSLSLWGVVGEGTEGMPAVLATVTRLALEAAGQTKRADSGAALAEDEACALCSLLESVQSVLQKAVQPETWRPR